MMPSPFTVQIFCCFSPSQAATSLGDDPATFSGPGFPAKIACARARVIEGDFDRANDGGSGILMPQMVEHHGAGPDLAVSDLRSLCRRYPAPSRAPARTSTDTPALG